jgi:chromosome partitioning protein
MRLASFREITLDCSPGGLRIMNVLALVTQKGGTGKSSLAVSLAVAAEEAGVQAAVLDIDPQGTASEWRERRDADRPEVSTISWSSLSSRLRTLQREGCGLAIIDTPGANNAAAEAAMREASLCLIPVRPSVADIEAAKPTIRYLSDREKPFAFVLNQCPVGGRTARTSHAFRALKLLSAVSDVTLANRADHMDALASGLGVTEHAPSGKAADEVRSLLDWLLRQFEKSGRTETRQDTPVSTGARRG